MAAYDQIDAFINEIKNKRKKIKMLTLSRQLKILKQA